MVSAKAKSQAAAMPLEDPLLSLTNERPTAERDYGPFHPGSLWRGIQRSGRASYPVCVRFVDCDLISGVASGYLRIRGLTPHLPELTTSFDAEIVGGRYGFCTGKWGATEAEDLRHWGRFPTFRPLKATLQRPALTYNHLNRPHVFMRWKERGIMPAIDGAARDISGASFDGFYYICLAWDPTEVASIPRFTSPSPRRSTSVSSARSPPPVRSPLPNVASPPGRQIALPSTSPTLPTRPSLRRPSTSTAPRIPFSYAAAVRGRSATADGLVTVSASAPINIGPPASPSLSVLFDNSEVASVNDEKAGMEEVEREPASPLLSFEDFPVPTSPTSISTSPRIGRQPRVRSVTSPSASEPQTPTHNEGYQGAYSQAKLTGFYFHTSSEPFQELALAYCGGGPADFADEMCSDLVSLAMMAGGGTARTGGSATFGFL